MRVDSAMAEAAVVLGPRVSVIAALESTLGPTEELLRRVAKEKEASVELHTDLFEDAWGFFEADDSDGYLTSIATHVGHAGSPPEVRRCEGTDRNQARTVEATE